MNILALDLATRTGWALYENSRIESGVQVFDVKRGESPGMRYVRFNRWMNTMLDKPLDLVVFEQSHHRGGAATEVAAGFATRVLEWCAEKNIEHCSYHTATIKKHACGKGNADKDAMVAAAAVKWPSIELIDDNHADALWILDLAISEYC